LGFGTASVTLQLGVRIFKFLNYYIDEVHVHCKLLNIGTANKKDSRHSSVDGVHSNTIGLNSSDIETQTKGRYAVVMRKRQGTCNSGGAPTTDENIAAQPVLLSKTFHLVSPVYFLFFHKLDYELKTTK